MRLALGFVPLISLASEVKWSEKVKKLWKIVEIVKKNMEKDMHVIERIVKDH